MGPASFSSSLASESGSLGQALSMWFSLWWPGQTLSRADAEVFLFRERFAATETENPISPKLLGLCNGSIQRGTFIQTPLHRPGNILEDPVCGLNAVQETKSHFSVKEDRQQRKLPLCFRG